MLAAASPAKTAQRVVSLNLCADQWLMLLAPEKIAALSPLARDPALSFYAREAQNYAQTRASAETVLAFRPDLVLGGVFGARTALSLLERSGIRVARLDQPGNFPAIRAGLRATAALLGVPDRAEAAIAAMDAALPPSGQPPRGPENVLVWQPRGWTSGPGAMMDAVVRRAGLINAGTGARVGLEALLRDPPSLLIVGENTAGDSLATNLLRHPAVRAIPTRTIPARLTICPGPWSAEAVGILTR